MFGRHVFGNNFWWISRYFAFFGEFRGISRKYLNFAGPRPREISEALLSYSFHISSLLGSYASSANEELMDRHL